MSHDVQALRALLDKLEAMQARGYASGELPENVRRWENERSVLAARVSAYSALVMHDAAHPPDTHIHRYVPSDDPNYLECDGCHHPLRVSELTTSVVMCTTCQRPIDECMSDRRGHRYTHWPPA